MTECSPGSEPAARCPLEGSARPRAAGAGKATTHGCRSTFKDWSVERTSFPHKVSEMALAHAISDKTERAYRRGELMKERAALMQQWANYVSVPGNAKVESIGEARRTR